MSRVLGTVFPFLLLALAAQAHEPEAILFDEIDFLPGGESHCPHLYKQGGAVCTLFPESIEGPFYRANQAARRDVRERKPGVPVTLTITLAEVSTCKPVPGITVDIWSADAAGEYSAFVGVGPGDPTNPRDNTTFLRGNQRSNRNGKLSFVTLFPGWYEGRTIHYHVAIHLKDKRHTFQLYVDETTSAHVARVSPYSRSRKPRTKNQDDSFYDKAAELKLAGNSRTGYTADVLMAFRVRRRI